MNVVTLVDSTNVITLNESCSILYDHSVRMIVTGSRGFRDESLFKAVIDEVLSEFKKNDIELISGMASEGPDKMVLDYAKLYEFPLMEFPARWDIYGKQADMMRNADMGVYATHILVFHDGSSKGTANMLQVAQKEHLVTKVVLFDPTIQDHLPFTPAFSAALTKEGKLVNGVNIFQEEARWFSDALGYNQFPATSNPIPHEDIEKAVKQFKTNDPFIYASTKSKSFLDFLSFVEDPDVSVSAIRLPVVINEPLTQMSKKI